MVGILGISFNGVNLILKSVIHKYVCAYTTWIDTQVVQQKTTSHDVKFLGFFQANRAAFILAVISRFNTLCE